MALCGFNQEMLEGIGGFHKGLVEHGIIFRSKLKKQSFQKTIDKELDDMDRFQKEMYRIKDPEIRELTKALTEYAFAFYKLVQKKWIENYKETIEFLGKLYLKIDDESNYREDTEVRELIELLIKYVNFFNNLVEKRGIENSKKTIDSMNKYCHFFLKAQFL